MIALYILSAIALVIILLLLCPVNARITYNEQLNITLRFLFYKLSLYPWVKKKRSKDKGAKKSENTAEKRVDRSIKSNGFSQTFEQLKTVIIPFIKLAPKTISHIQVDPFRFRLIMTGGDAADLAIDYGRLCSVFYPFLAMLCSAMKFGQKDVHIAVDFTKKDYEIDLDTTLRLRLCYAVSLALKVLWQIVKNKLREMQTDNKNFTKERTVSK